jgi:hypothetical protein
MTKVVIEGVEHDLEPPFITTNDIQDEIDTEMYFNFPNTPVTICCLKFKNGAYAIGKSMCINPKNFNDELGRQLARANAFNEAFPMLAYGVLEGMRPEPIIPGAPYSEPTITPENVGDIRWIDGGADLAEAVQFLAGIEDRAEGEVTVEYMGLGDLKAGV